MWSIVEEIKLSSKEALAKFYKEHRREFILWAKNNHQCEEDDAKDIYQATIVSFYENVVSGHLSELSSSSKTYLFAIGKNKIREMQRKRGKHITLEDGQDFLDEPEEIIDPSLLKLVDISLNRLGEPCKSLLQKVYYHKNSMATIVETLGYKNEDAAKSQKYKCLLRLRTIFKEFQIKTGTE
jgi:RNA polymerase sigma-70 factor (ECF subfamily)